MTPLVGPNGELLSGPGINGDEDSTGDPDSPPPSQSTPGLGAGSRGVGGGCCVSPFDSVIVDRSDRISPSSMNCSPLGRGSQSSPPPSAGLISNRRHQFACGLTGSGMLGVDGVSGGGGGYTTGLLYAAAAAAAAATARGGGGGVSPYGATDAGLGNGGVLQQHQPQHRGGSIQQRIANACGSNSSSTSVISSQQIVGYASSATSSSSTPVIDVGHQLLLRQQQHHQQQQQLLQHHV